MIKSVIIDDEPKAIQSLSWELSNFKKEIEIVATFSSPEEALEYLPKHDIDCLFLDIEMPTMDGFQFLEKLERKDFATVITTAYNEYAIKAFKKEAIDYLLKPIDTDDLEETIKKIKKHIKAKSNKSENLERMLLNFNNAISQKKIAVNTDGKLIFLDPNEIFFLVSDGNYCTIYATNNRNIVLTKKLKEVGTKLSEQQFFRIHNSYIINLGRIKEYFKSEGYVIMENDYKIPVSRQRKSEFLDKF